MRVSASLGLVVLLAALSACQQRNFARCLTTGAEYQCEAGKFCQPDPVDPVNGVGTCVDSQCSAGESPSRCSGSTPICNQGRCAACTTNSQCASMGSAQPFCLVSEGICVACSADADCLAGKDPYTPTPACDSKQHICRACRLHSECASAGQVCAKDDTLKSLPLPIPQGVCPPASRVLTLDETTCGGSCPLQNQVAAASVAKPYVLVKRYSDKNQSTITVAAISALPEQHIISANADGNPQQLGKAGYVAALKGNGAPAITVSAGASVTIEGMLLRDSLGAALTCNGGGAATSVKLLRSLIISGAQGIRATAGCNLTVDQSWIGTPPSDPIVNGNGEAMNLDSTTFDIVNTVFDHNFSSGFGGITLTDNGAPGTLQGRIVNSTFYRQENITTTIPALAVYCQAALTKPVTIFNTIFVNKPGNNVNANPYVHPNCYKAAVSLGYIATDETAPPMGVGIIPGVSDSIFTSALSSVLTLNASTAPKTLITGGVLQFNGSVAPTVDMLGMPRGTTSVSLGAFEVAH